MFCLSINVISINLTYSSHFVLTSDGWVPLKTTASELLWFSLRTFEVRRFPTGAPPHVSLPRSALLCDEMGLGKTLQILSLVLLRKIQKSASSGRENTGSGVVQMSETAAFAQRSISNNFASRRKRSQPVWVVPSLGCLCCDVPKPTRVSSRENAAPVPDSYSCSRCERVLHGRCCGPLLPGQRSRKG